MGRFAAYSCALFSEARTTVPRYNYMAFSGLRRAMAYSVALHIFA
jgi:hypothetical protein